MGEKVRLDDYLSIITIELEIGQKKNIKDLQSFWLCAGEGGSGKFRGKGWMNLDKFFFFIIVTIKKQTNRTEKVLKN